MVLGEVEDVQIWRKRMIRVDRDAMWNVLRLNGIGGRLLRGVKSLYVGCGEFSPQTFLQNVCF